MNVPPSSDPKWKEILTGQKKPALEFLAAKIMLGSAILQVTQHPDRLGQYAEEFRNLYLKNAHIPSAQRDITKIFG